MHPSHLSLPLAPKNFLEPSFSRYCPTQALAFATLSDLAYSSRRTIRVTLKSWEFETIDFFSLGHTEAFLVANAHQIIVIFRGSDEPQDWIHNLNFDLVSGPGGQVHCGFLNAVQGLWKTIQSRICQLRVQARWQGRELSLWLTGHSLGAALATLVTAQLRQANEKISGLYTYASPRVGDRTFAQNFNIDLGMRTFRIVNKNDLVPQLPMRSLSYCHVGQLFYFDHRDQLHCQSSAYFRFLDAMKIHANDLFDLDFSAAENHDIGAYLAALARHKRDQQPVISQAPSRRQRSSCASSSTRNLPQPV